VRKTHKRILKKAVEIRRRIYGIIPITEIRKNHSRIMAKVEAAKTRGRRTVSTGTKDSRGSRQHDENCENYENYENFPNYKKYNDIFEEPIDIWDEFLALRRRDD
jgi:hypothetical protein